MPQPQQPRQSIYEVRAADSQPAGPSRPAQAPPPQSDAGASNAPSTAQSTTSPPPTNAPAPAPSLATPLATPHATPAATPGQDGLSQAEQQQFSNSVSRGLAAAVRQKGGVVTLKLSPPMLGTLRIDMSLKGGVVAARLEASTQQARDLLTRNIEMLRTNLESKGFQVERINIHLSSSSNSNTGSQQQGGDPSAQDAHRQAQHDAADGRSRGAFDQRGRDGDPNQSDPSRQDGADQPAAESAFSSKLRVSLNAVA
ncbi:MAG: flagellar hook-length control protein FliK [Planctomycetota bacterium]|nr:flagellar hook-length control protein FliK [Planctomycetota bacterium]